MIDKKYIENYLDKNGKGHYSLGDDDHFFFIDIPLNKAWLDTEHGKSYHSTYRPRQCDMDIKEYFIDKILWNKEHNIWHDKDQKFPTKHYHWYYPRLGSFNYIAKRVFNDYKRGIISIDGHKTDGETFLPNILTGAEYLKLKKHNLIKLKKKLQLIKAETSES